MNKPLLAEATLRMVEKNTEAQQGLGWRAHLGASVIGRECVRQVWYIFRWAARTKFKARMLWLFERGNREEAIISGVLRKAGIHVEDVDPQTGEQWRVTDHRDHFGGSLDAQLSFVPDLPGVKVLGEYKTHNQKSYDKLTKEGVKKSKPEHYAQMQVYMHKKQLPAALYVSVNKNTDDMYMEVVYYDEITGPQMLDKAGYVIDSDRPPPRISDSPGWFICNWCDYRPVCHFNAPLPKNCRTCVSSAPIDDGEWFCSHWGNKIPLDFQKVGCEHHMPIPND